MARVPFAPERAPRDPHAGILLPWELLLVSPLQLYLHLRMHLVVPMLVRELLQPPQQALSDTPRAMHGVYVALVIVCTMHCLPFHYLCPVYTLPPVGGNRDLITPGYAPAGAMITR